MPAKTRRLIRIGRLLPIGLMRRIWPTLAWSIAGSPSTSASIARCSSRDNKTPHRARMSVLSRECSWNKRVAREWNEDVVIKRICMHIL
jgi:hypothetical protein